MLTAENIYYVGIDIIHLYSVVSNRGRFMSILGEGPPASQEKTPLEKMTTLPTASVLINLDMGGLIICKVEIKEIFVVIFLLFQRIFLDFENFA